MPNRFLFIDVVKRHRDFLLLLGDALRFLCNNINMGISSVLYTISMLGVIGWAPSLRTLE